MVNCQNILRSHRLLHRLCRLHGLKFNRTCIYISSAILDSSFAKFLIHFFFFWYFWDGFYLFWPMKGPQSRYFGPLNFSKLCTNRDTAPLKSHESELDAATGARHIFCYHGNFYPIVSLVKSKGTQLKDNKIDQKLRRVATASLVSSCSTQWSLGSHAALAWRLYSGTSVEATQMEDRVAWMIKFNFVVKRCRERLAGRRVWQTIYDSQLDRKTEISLCDFRIVILSNPVTSRDMFPSITWAIFYDGGCLPSCYKSKWQTRQAWVWSSLAIMWTGAIKSHVSPSNEMRLPEVQF